MFAPQLTGESANAATVDPLIAQGKALFEAQTCSACHGERGEGTAAGSKLPGISAKYPPDQLAALLRQPNEKMKAGGMTPLELKERRNEGAARVS